MDQPTISVIIPCYNYGNFISETLESIQKQTFKNWECIVVDDGSTDNSKAVVAEYVKKDPRIKYVYQENGGLFCARNTGIEHSIGEYLQFIDADDKLEVEKFERQLDAFSKNPDVGIVYSGLRFFSHNAPDQLRYGRTNNSKWALDKSGSGKTILPFLVNSCGIMPPMPLVKKTVIGKVGNFADTYCEDWDFWLRCAMNDVTFIYLDAPNTLSLMRVHDNNMTEDGKNMLPGRIFVRSRLAEILSTTELKKINNRQLNYDYVELSLFKQKSEGKPSGIKYIQEVPFKDKSSVFSLFSFLMKVFSPKFNLTLLKSFRSFEKKMFLLKK